MEGLQVVKEVQDYFPKGAQDPVDQERRSIGNTETGSGRQAAGGLGTVESTRSRQEGFPRGGGARPGRLRGLADAPGKEVGAGDPLEAGAGLALAQE